MATKLFLLAASSLGELFELETEVTELTIDDELLESYKNRPLPPKVGSYIEINEEEELQFDLALNLDVTAADGKSTINNKRCQYGIRQTRGVYFRGYGYIVLPRPGCSAACLDAIYNSPPAVGCAVCTVQYAGSHMMNPCSNCWECNFFAAVPPQVCFSATQAGCRGFPLYPFAMQPNSYGRCGPFVGKSTTQAGPTPSIAPITTTRSPVPENGPTSGFMYCMLGAMVGTSNSPAVWNTYDSVSSPQERSGTGTGNAWAFWDFTEKGITAFSGAGSPYYSLGFALRFGPPSPSPGPGPQFDTFAKAYQFCEDAGLSRVNMDETVPYAGLSPFVCMDDDGANGARLGACQMVNQNVAFADPDPAQSTVTEFFTWNINYWMCFTSIFKEDYQDDTNKQIMARNKAWVQQKNRGSGSQSGGGYKGEFETICERTGTAFSGAIQPKKRRVSDIVDEVIA